MHILYLSYDGLTDPLGQSQVLPYLIGLSVKGATIHIISFDKQERFEKQKSLIEKIVTENNLVWHPMAYTKRPPVLSTIYDLWHLRNKAKQIVQENKIEIVHCRSYLTSLVGLWLKKKLHTKFVFDMRGFWADERVEGKIWNLQNPIYKRIYSFFKNKEKQFLEQSDAIVCLTYAAKSEMMKWSFKMDAEKITVIPCCVDVDFFNKKNLPFKERNIFRKKIGVDENELLLIYTGDSFF